MSDNIQNSENTANKGDQIDVFISLFFDEVKKQIIRKQYLYDGYNNVTNSKNDIDYSLRYLMEESGEIASAITRERFELAKNECIDVAQTVFMLWVKLIEETAKPLSAANVKLETLTENKKYCLLWCLLNASPELGNGTIKEIMSEIENNVTVDEVNKCWRKFYE